MRNRIRIGILLLLVVGSMGCAAQKPQASKAEDVLQLNNDIVEDSLSSELDGLEKALMTSGMSSMPATGSTGNVPAVNVKETPTSKTAAGTSTSQKSAAPKTVAKISAVPKTDVGTNETQPVSAPATAVQSVQKRAVFGSVVSIDHLGLQLRLARLKALTPEERKKVKQGVAVPRMEWTGVNASYAFGDRIIIRNASTGDIHAGTLSDISSGSNVILGLDANGKILQIRIVP